MSGLDTCLTDALHLRVIFGVHNAAYAVQVPVALAILVGSVTWWTGSLVGCLAVLAGCAGHRGAMTVYEPLTVVLTPLP